MEDAAMRNLGIPKVHGREAGKYRQGFDCHAMPQATLAKEV